MKRRAIIGAVAVLAATAVPAQAGVTERAGWNVIHQAGAYYGIPLRLAPKSSARCDSDIITLPFKTTCAVHSRWPHVICYASINLRRNGQGTGAVLCSRPKVWYFKTGYGYDGKVFKFAGKIVLGNVPWA